MKLSLYNPINLIFIKESVSEVVPRSVPKIEHSKESCYQAQTNNFVLHGCK